MKKWCACGRVYNAADWKRLKHVGIQKYGMSEIDLRNCAGCGSTIAMVILRKDLPSSVPPS